MLACRVRGQWMLGGHSAEGDAHDGVGTRRKDVHASVLYKPACIVLDVVREGEAHAFALAYPVLLHQAHALWPAGQTILYLVDELFRIIGDAQVIAWDFAFFNQRAGAPA